MAREINALRHHQLITQLFVQGGTYLDSDAVVGVSPGRAIRLLGDPLRDAREQAGVDAVSAVVGQQA